MTYAPDLAGDFASDVHRRVLAALPLPGEGALDNLEDPRTGIVRDQHILTLGGGQEGDQLSLEEMEEVLKDLEADGHASKSQSGWKMTKAGHELLTAPPRHERDKEEA